jgi:capsular polysaccharide transport system permease protein
MTAGTRASFGEALKIQVRVLYALLMRESITRFGRANLGGLWLVAEPMIFTLGVATLWALSGLRHGTGISPVALAVTGYSSVLMWRNGVSRCAAALEQNRALLFHRNVHAVDVFAARIMLEALGATASFAVLALICAYFGWMPYPIDPLEVVMGWVMLAWFGAALAMLVGGATAFSSVVDKIWHPIAYLLFPLSGAAFMVSWLPQAMQRLVLWLPMVHGTEIIREGWFGTQVHAHYDIEYMAVSCILLSLSGLLVARRADRRVVP